MKIPFGTISITQEAKDLINQILDSKRVSSGKYVREFEERFADLMGIKEAVAVSSGTDADILALAVLHDFGAKLEDEIIVPALSFVATGHAVLHAGFKPVFVDIERETLNIDPKKIEKAITEKTKAIFPVHLIGKPAEMDTISQIAKKYNLYVIEDAAESIPENICVPIYSNTSTGTRVLTFAELWEKQRKKNKPQKTRKGEAIYLPNKRVHALSFLNGGQWMPIKAIYRHWYEGKIIKLNQKWGCIEATPNHSIYAANLDLTNPQKNPELLTIRKVNQHHKKYKKANKDILEILAAYITEGNATKNRRAYVVEIAEKDKKWLINIGNAIKREFGIKYCIIKGKRCYLLQTYKKELFTFLVKNCGKYCDQKYFPSWIFDLDKELQEFFWGKLLEGDGTKDGRYTTTSYKLANQTSLLLTLLGKNFVVYERIPKNKNKISWNFRTERNTHRGLLKKKNTEIDYKGWVYDLEIEKTHNFVCGIGNIVCHNSHGAIYKGRKVGTLGDMAAYSLYLAHIISSVEGGMVVTNKSEFADILRSLRVHGRACKCKVCLLNTKSGYCPKRFQYGEDIRFLFERIGYSAKMNELEAAVGLGNLNIYNEILEKRRKNLLSLRQEFEKFKPYLTTIEEGKDEKIGPHAFPIIIKEGAPFTRKQLVDFLEKNEIETRHLFSSMPTQCKGFSFLGYKLGDFPNSEYIGNNGLHIGVHQDLNVEHIDYFIEKVDQFLSTYLK